MRGWKGMRGLNGIPSKSMGPTTTALLSLFDVIQNSGGNGKGCGFCNLLLDAISMPAHDPLKNPVIKDHMPQRFEGKTFQSWVEDLRDLVWLEKKLNDSHPFGKSRNKITIDINDTDPDGAIREERREDLEARDQAALIGSAAGAGAGLQAASQQNGEANRIISAAGGVTGLVNSGRLMILNNMLPVAVRVKMHNITDAEKQGLLSVSVHGYGCKAQASLSVLCSFSLRVASDYQEDALGLRYGKIIQDELRVEADCRRWLKNCDQRHGNLCANPGWYRRLPLPSGTHFRLIEIDQRPNGTFFRIVQATTMTIMPKYAALSYVWGEKNTQATRQALKLYQDNISELSHRIPPKSLPRTIADAIEVTRRLGFRYLWVDSLCIIQQDPNRRDRDANESEARQSQLDQMGSIFGHASIVLVAAGGEDADCGLVGISQARKPSQIAQEVKPGVNVLLAVEYDRSYGKWDTRAWTLQEKLMSRRMLVFGQNYVSFHCRHGILREDMPAAHAGNGPPKIPHLSVSRDRAEDRARMNWDGTAALLRSPYFNEYAKILEQYTWRKRTESGDVLDAILGLLNVLEGMKSPGSSQVAPNITQGPQQHNLANPHQLHHHTLYGLPEEFLDLALLWQPPAATSMRLTKRENFPSWSWTGWKVTTKVTAPDHTAFRPHAGIRFEEPFRVSGNDDMSLRKFTANGNHAEERVRPLVMWYKWDDQSSAEGRLVPVNGTGLGIVCGYNEGLWFCGKALRFLERVGRPNVRPGTRLNSSHLICKTEVGKFQLRQGISKVDNKPVVRKEVIWKQGVDGKAVVAKELEIVEAEMLDADGNVVGHVIPTDQKQSIATTQPYDFILLSGSQYWGNEERIDVLGYPLFNVMMVEWDRTKEFATRLGLGKISKTAWEAAKPRHKSVVLT